MEGRERKLEERGEEGYVRSGGKEARGQRESIRKREKRIRLRLRKYKRFWGKKVREVALEAEKRTRSSIALLLFLLYIM